MANATREVTADEALTIAVRYHQAGDTDRAEGVYRKLTELAPKHPEAWHLLGVLTFQRGKSTEAEVLMRHALELYGSVPNPDCLANLAAVLLDQGKTQEAISRLGDALAIDPNNAVLLTNMGNALKQHQNNEGALYYYSAAYEAAPDNIDVVYNYALACQQSGDVPKAATLYQTLFDAGIETREMVLGFLACLEEIDRKDASALYASEILTRYADDAEIICAIGRLHLASGDVAAAVGFFERALGIDEDSKDAKIGLASAYLNEGVYEEAKEILEGLLTLYPDDTVILNNLGLTLVELGDYRAATDVLLDAQDLGGDDFEPMVNLAIVFIRRKKPEIALIHIKNAAKACLTKLREVRFGDLKNSSLGRIKSILRLLQCMEEIDEHVSLLHGELKEDDEKITVGMERLRLRIDRARFLDLLARGYEGVDEAKATQYKSDFDSLSEGVFWELNEFFMAADDNIRRQQVGDLLKFAGVIFPDHAMFSSLLSLSFLGLGMLTAAEEAARRAIELADDSPGYHNNLGLILHQAHRLEEAKMAFERAIELDPRYVAARGQLGYVLIDLGRVTEASELFQLCAKDDPDHYMGWDGLSSTYSTVGLFDEAEKASERVLALAPSSAMHSNMLFRSQYNPAITAEELRDRLFNWADLWAAPSYDKQKPLFNDRDPDRKLKVGYIGPDFRGHSSSYFLAPIFQNHDRTKFEITTYAQVPIIDRWTRHFESFSDHWYNTSGMPDDVLADQIRKDGIDILVELGCHTANSRALVTAQRPAPIQVSYIGVGNTTGIRPMDYFLTDQYMVPEGYDHLFSEQPWRLPRNIYCYEALNPMPEVAPTPALANGYVTFGSFARAIRFNDGVFDTWAAILRAVPGSRLMINTRTCLDEPYCARVRAIFKANGVDPDRLDLVFTTPTDVTWATYDKLDIAFDPFPHNAGLTTYEALYMGVPVVTLADRPPQGRYGASILSNVGHPEWVAKNRDDYVRIAVDLASDIGRLASMRSGAREKMKASPLYDGAGFVRDLEDAYRQMWRRWCADGKVDAA